METVDETLSGIRFHFLLWVIACLFFWLRPASVFLLCACLLVSMDLDFESRIWICSLRADPPASILSTPPPPNIRPRDLICQAQSPQKTANITIPPFLLKSFKLRPITHLSPLTLQTWSTHEVNKDRLFVKTTSQKKRSHVDINSHCIINLP